MRSVTYWLCSTALCLAVIGCGKGGDGGAQPTQTKAPEEHDHDHAHDHDHGAGPHGGTIVEWGGGAYHAEFVVDHDKKEAVVYILDGQAKATSPIKAEKLHLHLNDPEAEIELVAQPLDGEPEGAASRFVGQHDALAAEKLFEGSITGEVEGTPYVGEFKETEHPADHKH